MEMRAISGSYAERGARPGPDRRRGRRRWAGSGADLALLDPAGEMRLRADVEPPAPDRLRDDPDPDGAALVWFERGVAADLDAARLPRVDRRQVVDDDRGAR